MSDFTNRLGHDNFVWWIGVVEDRFDPLNVGRCRVRIFGSHTDNLDELPTRTLPWATPLYPINNSKTFSTPMEGDYVFGFFLDGTSSQAPAMLGVFPAISQVDGASQPEGIGFSGKAKLKDPTLSANAKLTPIVYANTPAMTIVRQGEPTGPASSHTKAGTGIEASDNSRAHVCDIANLIKFDAAKAKMEAFLVFTGIRTAIEAVTSGLSGSSIGTQIAQAVKVIKYYVKIIKDAADFINEVVLEIASYIKYLKEMIAYVLSLPAKLYNDLVACLNELYSSLTGALNISGSTGILSDVKSLISDVATTAQSVQTTIAVTSTVVSATSALLSPNSFGKI
jgi:hypothetical protein